MKSLLILLVAFIIFFPELIFFQSNFGLALSGRIAMLLMFTLTVAASFVLIQGLALMLPRFIPYMTSALCLAGITEISGAAGLTIPGFRAITAWLLISFFILVLTANIYTAPKQNDYKKITNDGNGFNYLVPGTLLQILFKAWAYLPIIKGNNIKIEKSNIN